MAGQFVVGSFFASDNTCEICQAGYQTSCVNREILGTAGGAQATQCMTDDDERHAALESPDWCRSYVVEQDPLSRPVRTSKVEPASYSDVAEFRKRLGYGSSFC